MFGGLGYRTHVRRRLEHGSLTTDPNSLCHLLQFYQYKPHEVVCYSYFELYLERYFESENFFRSDGVAGNLLHMWIYVIII